VASGFDAVLRQARLRAGLPQEQLAHTSGVGVRTIRRLETGEHADPRPPTARRLADALGLAPDEHARLLAAAVGAPEAESPARPGTRNDLPGDIADFTGRVEEVDRLLATIPIDSTGQATVVIDAIDGMAGVGKTTLAVHVAHHLLDRYPDAQLFIDLHGHASEHEATDPAAALDALLRAVGVPGDRIPDGVDQRASLWRAELAGRAVVVVLDNAATAAQVRPLLPGSPGCLALITSRRRLADLETARILSLDVLPVHDAIALFDSVAGADRVVTQRQAVTELVRLCGYLPLAIRIAAARLRSRPAWTVQYLADRLRHAWRLNESIEKDAQSYLSATSSTPYTPTRGHANPRTLSARNAAERSAWRRHLAERKWTVQPRRSLSARLRRDRDSPPRANGRKRANR
jgi:transcriptional regulator with XRE-family HTH domain